MFENIKRNEKVLIIGEHSETVDNLFIHLSDYGDSYYDLVICYKETEELFGGIAWCAIPSSKIENLTKELMEITNIQDVRREKIEPSEWM